MTASTIFLGLGVTPPRSISMASGRRQTRGSNPSEGLPRIRRLQKISKDVDEVQTTLTWVWMRMILRSF